MCKTGTIESKENLGKTSGGKCTWIVGWSDALNIYGLFYETASDNHKNVKKYGCHYSKLAALYRSNQTLSKDQTTLNSNHLGLKNIGGSLSLFDTAEVYCSMVVTGVFGGVAVDF